MKAILISDKPKWCALMMNGDKIIEVRRNKALANAIQKLIDEQGYADIYVHCSKNSHQLVKPKDYDKYLLFTKGAVDYSREHTLNGKVVFKFRCYKVEEHKDFACMFPYSKLRYNKATCLSEEDLEDYGFVEGKGYVPLYAIHISDLEIFDRPRELSEFIKCDNNHIRIGNCFIGFGGIPRLTKAPQNFCYVEVE